MDVTNQATKIVGFLGRRGSGKSTALREMLERCDRFLLFDVNGEHGRWCPNAIYDLDRLYDFLAWAVKQEHAAARFIPEYDVDADFASVCEAVYRTGHLVFGVEEIPVLAGASFVPPEFGNIVRLGRHRKIGLYWTGQRAAECPRTLTAMTDAFVIFSTQEPRDLEAIADRCGRDVAEQVARLPLHGKLVWDAVPST